MSSDAERGNVSIALCGVGKRYEIYAKPQDRLKQLLWPGKRQFFREFKALDGIDLEVRRGECVGIVGRNGSGKSTLLKLICGTLEPSDGDVTVAGAIAPMLMLGAGFSPEFTGRENALLNATILGQSTREVEERMDSIIEFADIGEFFDRPVKSYSSGMYARLAFAVAISSNPDILVIDEVLAVGDEAFMRKCFARIDEIKRAGATILFVSHSPNLVVDLCDRALLLEGGERLLYADPKTVIASYHRLLYGDSTRYDETLREVRAMDAGTIPLPKTPVIGEAGPVYTGSYDPNLEPESTVEYERRGAVIRDARILDAYGERVNQLVAGLDYEFRYTVDFGENAFGVRFGTMIKLVTGFELAGQTTHPNGRAIDVVEAGARAEVCFRFSARLIPGAYFMNAGVLAVRDGAEQYLHRVLDAIMFRVAPIDDSLVTGQADLSAGTPDVVFAAPETRLLRRA